MCYAAQSKFNYSAVAELYGALCNQVVGQNLITFFDLYFENSMARTCVLDVGYGTGKPLADNQSWFPDTSMGLNLFDGMFKIAWKRFGDHNWWQITNGFKYGKVGRLIAA